MTLISCEGKLGKGKTMTMVQHGLKSFRERTKKGEKVKLYSNIHLYNLDMYAETFQIPKFKYSLVIDPMQIQELSHAVILMDEFWGYLNAKSPKKTLNNVLAEIILSSRKTDQEIVWTNQHFRQTGIQLRRVTDYRTFPVYNKYKGVCKVYVYDYDYYVHGETKLGDLVLSYRYNAPFIMNFYDHEERVMRPERYQEFDK